jgi:hypothetical protein
MKYMRVSTALVSVLALFIAGCGKSQEQQKMEIALNAEVMTLQKDVESNISSFTELMAKLEATRQMHKRLEKQYAKKMKKHNADDITAASQLLESVERDAKATLKDLTVYDKQTAHDQAMIGLNRDKESLMKIKERIAEAVGSANEAIANHEQMKNSLTKKSSVTKKTPAKASGKNAGSS